MNGMPKTLEGVYFFTINASAHSIVYPWPSSFECPYPYYGYWQDSRDFPGL